MHFTIYYLANQNLIEQFIDNNINFNLKEDKIKDERKFSR